MTRKEIATSLELFGGTVSHPLDNSKHTRWQMDRWQKRPDAPVLRAMMRLGWLTEPDEHRVSLFLGCDGLCRKDAVDALCAEIAREEVRTS